MTFPKRQSPQIIRVPGPTPRLEVSPPKAKQVTVSKGEQEPCTCKVNDVKWAIISSVNSQILTDDLAYTETLITATLGRIGANNAVPMAPYLFYAGFVDSAGASAYICPDQKVTWSYEWSADPTKSPALIAAPNTETLLVHLGYFYDNIDGDAIPNSMFRNIEPGILSVSATVCGKSFGPISLTIEAPPVDPYGGY